MKSSTSLKSSSTWDGTNTYDVSPQCLHMVWGKSVNLANAYLGLAYYEKGEYETAQKYLSAFSADETVLSPAVTAAIGNCLVDMEKYAESAKYFEKAAKVSDNAVFSPIYLKKATAAYEKVGNNEAAVKLYQEIKDKYPTSNDARGIERYIERAQNK